jgi:FdrA protein
MTSNVRVIKARYADSVVLMRLAERLTQIEGVIDAAALMGTAANKTLLREGGFVATDPPAESDDLVVAVKADSEAIAESALARADEFLAERAAAPSARSPRTLAQALESHPDLNLAAISLPGEYAADEARCALEKGLHVFLFSSNVSVEDEVALKTLAQERGLLCMGPDCGTALIAGTALGFGNAVRRGPVGIVAAAGSGIQAVTSHLDDYGVGVSHAIGCGGRDLSEAVGAKTMLVGLDALLADDSTEAVLLLSKPPAPAIAAKLRQRAATASKPVLCCLLGESGPETLEQAARAVAVAVGATPPPAAPALDDDVIETLARRLTPTQRYVRGLYAGGTLAYEAQLVLRRHGVAAASNAPLLGAPPMTGGGHIVLDMGGEEFTTGRPHPMIDGRARRARLWAEATDDSVAVVLLDFVLGFGAAADPAGDLAYAIADARAAAESDGRDLVVLAYVCGTASDSQDLVAQQQRLRDAGAIVFESNAAMAESAARLVGVATDLPVTAVAGGA